MSVTLAGAATEEAFVNHVGIYGTISIYRPLVLDVLSLISVSLLSDCARSFWLGYSEATSLIIFHKWE